MLVNTNAFILKTIEYEDNDLIIYSLTQKYGLVSFIAKGVRKPNSKNIFGLWLYSNSNLDIFKSNRLNKLGKLKTAVINKKYYYIEKNYKYYVLIYFLSEFIIKNNIRDSNTFILYDWYLNNLNQNLLYSTSIIYLKLLFKIGNGFYLKGCYLCNHKVIVGFSIDNKGYVCKNCIKENIDYKIIYNKEFLETINNIYNYNFDNNINSLQQNFNYKIILNIIKILINLIEENTVFDFFILNEVKGVLNLNWQNHKFNIK